MLKRLMSGVLSLVMLGTMFPTVKTAEKTQPVVQQGENPVSSPMDYQISSTNSLGNYINDMVGKQNMLNTSAAEVPQDERFMVNNLEFDNVTGKLTVKSTQTSDSKVVIRINDEESGKTLIEKSAEAASGESVATVFDIDKTKLSEFYIVTAVLVDEKGNEICNSFEYKKYTKDIQKVIASDIHDFKEEQVIQLDKSEDTNFVVLSEDTIKAESNAEKNVLLSADYDNGVFVFENPDDTIRNLKSGESFYIQPNENDVITIIVGTVEINGNQATLRASDEPIDDMFDFIKLEATSDQSGMIVDTSKADESLQFDSFENDGLVHELDSCGPITFEAWLALDGTVEGSSDLTIKKPDDVETGSWLLDHLSGSVELSFTLSYYKSLTKTMIDFELKSSSSLTVEVGLSSEDLPNGNPTIDLPGFSIPTPIPGIVVDISPCIEFSLEGSISVSFNQEVMVGFTYENGDLTPKSEKDDGSLEVKAEAEASVMLNFEVDLAVIDDELASVGLTFGLGLKFAGETNDVGYRNKVKYSSSSKKVDILSNCNDDSVHACDLEIEGTWSFVIGVSVEAEIIGLSFEKGLEFSIELGKSYFSPRSGFGWGECDYNKYRIEIYVDPGESEYENAVVKLDGLACNLYSLPNTAVFYGLNTGSSSGYYYSVESGGKTLKTGSIRVNNASQRLTINLDNGSTGSSVGPTVTTTAKVSAPKIPSTVIATAPKPDIPRILEVGTLGDNISYTLYETGELWVYGYGDMKDFSSSPFKNPDKVKKVSFEHKNPKKNLYITSIGNRVFYNCYNLPEIVIPDTVTRIGDYAFSGCSALQFGNLVLSSKITYVGAEAFYNCAGLTSIEVPETVKTIGNYAFGNCTGLKSAVIKDGVGSIGEYIFDRCTALEELTLPYAGPSLESVNKADSSMRLRNNLFINSVKDKTYSDGTYYCIPNSLKKITITGGTRIPSYAFYGFSKVTEIVIPESITSIGNYAFCNCTGLKRISFHGNAPAISSNAFTNVTTTAYYQNGNKTWTSDVKQNYGGNITWKGINLLKITKQPTNAAAPKDKAVNVTVTAKGDGLTYKWYYRNKGASSFSYTSSFDNKTTYSVTMSEARDGRELYCVITDKYGNTATTDIVTIYMGNPVKITKQPQIVVVKSGETAKTTVTAEGDGLTYKWYYKDKGASKFSYTSTFSGAIYSATMNETRNGRQIYCVITDKYGISAKTKTVTLNMGNPMKITKQPVNTSAKIGEQVKVTIGVTGDGLTYKWYYKNKGASGFSYTSTFDNMTTYSAEMSSARDGRQVYCVIKDKYGVELKTNTVTIGVPVAITKQPVNASAAVGKKVSTSVTATGHGLKYQWYVKNPGQTSFTKSSVTSAVYEYVMSEAKNGRQVYCVITDMFGNKVKTATVTLGTPVTIKKQPTNAAATMGTNMLTSVKAEGHGLKYQWYYCNDGGTTFKKSSITSATYSCQMTEDSAGRRVYCEITDMFGNKVKTRTVTLKSDIKIISQPTNASAAVGKKVSTSVTATGTDLKYQWYVRNYSQKGFYPSSITDATYEYVMTAEKSGRQAYCVITDRFGNSVTTDTVTFSAAK